MSAHEWIGAARTARDEHMEFARSYKSISIATADPVSRERWRKAASIAAELAREANRRLIRATLEIKAGAWSVGSVNIINK